MEIEDKESLPLNVRWGQSKPYFSFAASSKEEFDEFVGTISDMLDFCRFNAEYFPNKNKGILYSYDN